MASDVELIEFVRPCGNQNNLYVTNISRDLSVDDAQFKLFNVFASFGLLYEVQVFDGRENNSGFSKANSAIRYSVLLSLGEEKQTTSCHDNNCRGYLYAFIKYYSTKDAARAKRESNNKYLIGGQYLKVQFANRKKCVEEPALLYMARCIELANYYIGFNGWSTSIIKIENLDGSKEHSTSLEHETFMFRCIVRLEIKSHECYCEGTGYGGDKSLLPQEKDPLKKLELTAIAKKVAHRHAFENAFRRVIIIALGNGKVGVEINQGDMPQSELVSGMSEDGIVHVNYREELPSSDEEIHDDDILEALDAITEPLTN